MVCKNCKKSLIPENNYCSACGGRVIRNRLTIRNLFEHLSETFFNYDNKLLRTFTRLFTAPEDVIGGYIDGVRKKYVNPISYLGLALTFGGLYIFIMNRYFPDSLDLNSMTMQGQEEMANDVVSTIQEYYTIAMVLFLPVYALFSRVVFLKRKDFNYTEHIILWAYLFAQVTLVTSTINIVAGFFNVPGDYLGIFSIIIQVWYYAFCLKRLYKLSMQGIILRTLLFFSILILISIFLMLLGFVFALIFKDTEFVKSLIESQKAAQEAAKAAKEASGG